MYTADIKKLPRKFLPTQFEITDWSTLEPYFKELEARPIDSVEDMNKWLMDMSELEANISEDACWRQIRMTCDTENKEYTEAFTYFMMEVQPLIQLFADRLNRKFIESPFSAQLDQQEFFTYTRNIKKSIDLFRKENISLQAELSVEAQEFGAISGKMTVEINGQEFTLQQAAKFLEDSDRSLRENVYKKMGDRRLQNKDALQDLYTKLIEKRHQVAVQADFENFVGYRFLELGRFDYAKKDCEQFHEAVKQHVMPLVNSIYERKKQELGIDQLRPWDVDAQPHDQQPLRPFVTGDELLKKTQDCFNQLNPFFSNCLFKMKELGHLDLESRKGKAPGGYNCPLAVSGAPFIFMNAAGTMNDVTTMVHEGGHAIHSFLSHPLELNGFKEYPTEIAEVASMSMELFSMSYWNVFLNNETDLKKAQIQQLERVITIFPWIATIDKFQFWIYENPQHTPEERNSKWVEILNEFTSPVLDISGLEEYRKHSWQRQLHLFEVPFYYIEYGIAQLGAIGMWQQFMADKDSALSNYIKALSLGGTKTLPQLFEAAGLKFDLSPQHIQNLMTFVKKELEKLW